MISNKIEYCLYYVLFIPISVFDYDSENGMTVLETGQAKSNHNPQIRLPEHLARMKLQFLGNALDIHVLLSPD